MFKLFAVGLLFGLLVPSYISATPLKTKSSVTSPKIKSSATPPETESFATPTEIKSSNKEVLEMKDKVLKLMGDGLDDLIKKFADFVEEQKLVA